MEEIPEPSVSKLQFINLQQSNFEDPSAAEKDDQELEFNDEKSKGNYSSYQVGKEDDDEVMHDAEPVLRKIESQENIKTATPSKQKPVELTTTDQQSKFDQSSPSHARRGHRDSIPKSILTNSVKGSIKQPPFNKYASATSSQNQSPTSRVDATEKQQKIHQKKVMFYPDIARMKQHDKNLYDFLKKDFGDPFGGKMIDPDDVDFQSPDFGFNNDLIFEDNSNDGTQQYSSNWKYIMDYAMPFPKFQRVSNYIQFVNNKKFQEEQKQFAKLQGGHRNSLLVKKQTNMKNMSQQEQFRIMQEMKAAREAKQKGASVEKSQTN